MNIGWPEGIYLALFFVGIGVNICKLGEEKGKYAPSDIVVGFLILGLLYWGGFFN
jgi:hypothetical protein